MVGSRTQYMREYREKKRQQDEEKYLKENREQQAAYRKKQKEKQERAITNTETEDVDEITNCETDLLNEIIQFKEATGENISFRTIGINFSRIKTIFHLINTDINTLMCDFNWIKNNHKNIINKINSKYKNANTQKAYIASFCSIIKHYENLKNEYDLFYKSLKDQSQKILDKTKENVATPKQIERNIFDWNKIKTASDGKKLKLDNLVLFQFVTLQPPRRLLDYQYLTLANEQSDTTNSKLNYLVVNKDNYPIKVIYNFYKTRDIYGTQTFLLQKTLAKTLQKYIKESKIEINQPLFPNRKGEYNKDFSKKIPRIFNSLLGKPISINDLRHSYISWYLNKKKRTVKQREILAKLMGHSVDQQGLYEKIE